MLVLSFLATLSLVVVDSAADRIVAGANRQVSEAAVYTPGYFKIAYPNGDLPRDKGVCTDVVIRSLRSAGYDLQRLIHEDMKRSFMKYPQRYGATGPDKNIDHRRVPNQMSFFKRHGVSLSTSTANLKSWKPGDIVYWKLDSGLDHCGIVSAGTNGAGVPLVIHNLGRCVEEDCLTSWKITGHFRYPIAGS